MTVALLGPLPGSWKMTRDESGYRNYEIKHLVQCSVDDGPANALQCPGLPLPGSLWEFKDDVDVWAWCKLDAEVDPKTVGDKGEYFVVTNHFTTQGTNKKCCVEPVDDPLLEPTRISGNSVKFTEEGTRDRLGHKIENSAHELIRGPQNEWDNNRHVVKVEQNVAELQLNLCTSMVNSVNDDVLWGHAKRTVKLSNFTWEKKYRGDCEVYYTRTFEFEINHKTWDRDLLDEGTKVLNGYWWRDGNYYRLAYNSEDNSTLNPPYDGSGNELPAVPDEPLDPDPNNPSHFIRFQDKNGNQARVILDGGGLPFNPDAEIPTHWWITNDPVDSVWWETQGGVPEGTMLAQSPTQIFEDTCADAVFYAMGLGAYISGPYDSQEDAEDAWANYNQLLQPDFFTPANELEDTCEAGTTPGSIHVEKYLQTNFLLLDLPTEL